MSPLTPLQARALRFIASHLAVFGDSPTQRQIAERVGCRSATRGRQIVDALARRGLVLRDSGRRRGLTLTDAGRARAVELALEGGGL